MSVTQLFLVRHAQTEWNRMQRVQGQLDIPLSDVGIVQAHAIARHFAQHRFDAIVSSDLQRALQTATIINAYHNHEIKISTLLREQHYGIAQGLMRNEVSTAFAVAVKTLNQRETEYCVPHAETYIQLRDRAVQAIDTLVQSCSAQTILVLTHGNVIRSLIRHSLNDHQMPVSIGNCAIARFRYSGGTLLFEQLEQHTGLQQHDEQPSV